MSQAGTKLRKLSGAYCHRCPACEEMHVIYTEGGVKWDFNGKLDKPTFRPSVRLTWNYGPEKKPQCCHYFITDGNIQFQGDCSHKLAGHTVPLPDLPAT